MMGDDMSPRGKRPTPIWWWAASLVLVAAGVAGVIYATHHGPVVGPSIAKPFGRTSLSVDTTTTRPVTTTTRSGPTTTRPSGPTTSQATHAPTTTAPVTPTTKPPSPGFVVAAPVARSIPLHLAIPALGISVHLTQLGLNKDHTVQVPTDFAVPGWYKDGPTPGQEGSAVILGHVDSYLGPAVFSRLGDLRLGNRVYVKEANGKTRVFAVIGLREYLKTRFPDRLIYGHRKYPALQIVTCGGIFDRQTGHYLSNIVVFTAMVKR
jgi:Sortase domain